MHDPQADAAVLAFNLASLRKAKNLSQEKVAEKIGVSRQALAKWESGDTSPDVLHANALASLYEVSLDDLVRFDQDKTGVGVPPKGKHLFGTVQVGERGQIVIPKKAREMLGLQHGDMLVVLGDFSPAASGIALMTTDAFLRIAGQK